MDGQGTECRRNIAQNLNRLSRAHECYRQTTDRRQTTDGRAIAYSEREREFTFAKNVPPSTRYNLDIHDPITIIFGRSVIE